MLDDEPSRTAIGTATLRAAHQLFEQGRIFADPYAVGITGLSEADIRKEAEDPYRKPFMADVAVRSRYTEDKLAAAAANGMRQLVIMGAGLDTFGLRNPHAAAGLQVFEIDHPATQRFKRARIAAAGWPEPDWLHFVPVDFERDSWVDRLQDAASGFDAGQPAFFSWLGVVTYLAKATTYACIEAMAAIPGAEIVVEYGIAPEHYSAERRQGLLAMIKRCTDIGEPWIGLFAPGELQQALQQRGFAVLDDMGPHQTIRRYLPSAPTPPAGSPGACLLHARRL